MSQTPAHAGEPNNNCAQLAQPPLVRVIYTDVTITEDYTQSITSLKALSGHAMDQHHSVYGLTHATPKLDYEFKAAISSLPDGKVCMVPVVTIKAGFSDMQVYLAKELQDSCKKQIIREHEFEHVSAWKSHMRAGTKLMELPLKNAFAQPRQYDSRSQAEQDLRPWVQAVMKPLERRLMENIATAQRAIDSSFSYGNVENRLRTCPP
ncbi:MAG: hypothetical protein Q8N02_02160 [Methylotenera sp.]|nr:hypothetical protein [Methylotenera sp.]MDP2404588.1 hypothetical protein [Methylotenera sp.]MDP3094368.1 hypothetical protein [Methylotenera sp.]MDZ4222200.1 hypothetical protein [Methylotenera sp.]